MNANIADRARSRMMGLETEYGFTLIGRRALSRPQALDQLFSLAGQRLVHLPCRRGGGVYLGNGARFYLDSGCHPEYCTPEVNDPAEAVSFFLAGDRIVQDLARAWQDYNGRGTRMVFFKCNVDYSGSLTSWACHESYAHKANVRALPGQLIPHFATRLIYTGAGGFNPFSPGLRFCYSPRVYHLQQAVSGNSTHQRGIYHLKNESLAGPGWNRLHVLCGDSVFSHRANYLKLGTTALLLALAEAGLQPARHVQMREPLCAMKQFNEDLAMTSTVRLHDGDHARAIDIQRRLLEEAEAHLDRSFMPSWAPQVCSLWRETLDQLEQGPAAVASILDWAMKQALYEKFAAERGFSPDTWPDWTHQVSPRPTMKGGRPVPPEEQPAADPERERELVLRSLTRSLPVSRQTRPGQGLSPRQKTFVKLREALCELDLKFSWVGSQGLFSTLEQTGQLNHRLPQLTEARLESAATDPPDFGRGRVRGSFVREHARKAGYSADWCLLQAPGRRVYEIFDPNANDLPAPRPAQKRSIPPSPPPPPSARHRDFLNRIKPDYQRGEYERGYHQLLALPILRAQMSGQMQDQYHQLLAWFQARRGYAQDALIILRDQFLGQINSPETILDFISVFRFYGLAPYGSSFWVWLEKGRALWEGRSSAARDRSSVFAFRGHYGYGLGCAGRLDEAAAVLENALTDQARRESNPRLYARSLADLAEIRRRTNRTEQGVRLLDEAEQLQVRHHCQGDFAEFTLAARAKTASDNSQAMAWLTQARSIQNELHHRPGLARTLLLEARFHDQHLANELRLTQVQSLADTVPSLAQCPLVRKILTHWEVWATGGMIPGENDHYWGL